MKTIRVMRDGRPATDEELRCAVEGEPLPPARMHRKTLLKAFEEEKQNWRWATMPSETEALVLAFCACVHLRMQGTSMDEVLRPNEKLSDRDKSKATYE